MPGGYLFNMCGIVVAGYIFGHTLERYTTVNSVVGMTLIGAICRNIGATSYLNNEVADLIDFHLRYVVTQLLRLVAGIMSDWIVTTTPRSVIWRW